MQGRGHRVASLPPLAALARHKRLYTARGQPDLGRGGREVGGARREEKKGGCVRCVWGRAGRASS
jgi:hypothetical protein